LCKQQIALNFPPKLGLDRPAVRHGVIHGPTVTINEDAQRDAEYGLDSLTAVELSQELEDWLHVDLTPVIAWNYPTPATLAKYLATAAGGAGWLAWPSAALLAAATGLALAARGVPAGATRDFLTWLGFACCLLWAAWWIVAVSFA
jgi:acyl carrier protein